MASRFPPVSARISTLFQLAQSGKLTDLKRLAREFDNGKGLAKVYVTIKDADGAIALHHAAAGGNSEVCEYLVKKLKIDVNIRDVHGTTPLHMAAESNCLSTVKCLVQLGADLNLSDKIGDSAMHFAAKKGNAEILEFLISKGAIVDLIAGNPGTPLHRAASVGQKEALKVLLIHKANPNSVMHHFFTPLMMAMVGEAAESFESSELLLKAGADPNIGDCGVTHLGYAASMRDVRMIKCLLKYGANPNAKGDCGLTTLEYAALIKHDEMMDILFPLTARIESYREWSIDGILQQIHSREGRKRLEESFAVWREKGKQAFQKKDYLNAIFWYTQGLRANSCDETALSNRSLCWARLNEGENALIDADDCASLRPDWSKAHYRRGAALKILKLYIDAAKAFGDALNLDPNDKQTEKELREVMEMVRREQ